MGRKVMHSVGWLHFTDLHFGLGPQRWMWPQVEDEFRRDLEVLHRRSGPWDLVFFTGDLSQRGSAEELARLDVALDALFEHLRQLGSDPLLVAVPGNHDLRRPAQVTPTLRALRQWHDDPELREEFWTKADSPYRALVAEAFAPYSAWHAGWRARHPLPAGATETPGLLPGDQVLSFSRNGVSLGLVGLNSAFLQLTDGDYQGKLDLDVRQMLDATGGAPGAWARQHTLNLLLTHHPPEWLHPRALAHYRSHVTPHDRFTAHLYGHMHEPTAVSMKIGGAPTRRVIQGASLFGLEHWGEEETRIHGYSGGRFEVSGAEAHLRVWPRIMRAHQDAGHYRLVPDFDHFDLDPDSMSWTDTAIPVRSKAPDALPPVPSTPPPAGRTARPPGAPYHPDWFVARPAEEREAGSALGSAVPVVVVGASLSGTSWFVRHVSRVWTTAHPPSRVVDLDLGLLSAAGATADAFFESFAHALLEAADDRPKAEEAWQRAGNTEWRLTNLMRALLGRDDAAGPLLLVVERADAVIGQAAEAPFFRMLRAWSESIYKAPWTRLRLLLAMSTAPQFLRDTDVTSPFFNRTTTIHLRDFDLGQLRAFAGLLGVRWSDADLTRLLERVGGHPYLVHAVLFQSALGEAPDRLLDLAHLEDGVFRQHLALLWTSVARDPGAAEALRKVLSGSADPLAPRDVEHLRTWGVCHRESRGPKIRNALYERYFRQVLGPP